MMLILRCNLFFFFFFFNDTATTEIYTLSLHDALPICDADAAERLVTTYQSRAYRLAVGITANAEDAEEVRSEEHTSELQSRLHLVCRLLLEKKKKKRETNLIVASRSSH